MPKLAFEQVRERYQSAAEDSAESTCQRWTVPSWTVQLGLMQKAYAQPNVANELKDFESKWLDAYGGLIN